MNTRSSCIATLNRALARGGKVLIIASLVIAALANTGATPPRARDASAPPVASLATSPYLLVENVGQYAPEAKFLLQRDGLQIWLTEDAIWLNVPDQPALSSEEARARARGGPRRLPRIAAKAPRSGTAIRFTFEGADRSPILEPFGAVSTRISYLIGRDSGQWHRDVPAWTGVRYRDLYPGVDLLVGDDSTGLVPWRFEVRSGAEAPRVAMRAEGAETLTVERGGLRMGVKGRSLDVAAPAWLLPGATKPAGSVAESQGEGVVALSAGSELATGQAAPETVSGTAGLADLIYNTSLGGSGDDGGYGIAVDGTGNAYVTGMTKSYDFPGTTGHYDPVNTGPTGSPEEAFVAKLGPAGNVLYATYLGGQGSDIGNAIAVDAGTAFVVGSTDSPDFPGMTGTPILTDIFAVALNPDGNSVRYVTRLGGDGDDSANGVAVDGTGVYLTGSSDSTSLALAAACASLGNANLVVAKLDASGVPQYTTCLGGAYSDVGYGIAVLNREAYAAGWSGTGTSSYDILLAKFGTTGTVAQSKLLGGSGIDYANAVAVDGGGNIYIAGVTGSSNGFPFTAGARPYAGGDDAFVMKLTPAMSVSFATYLGGTADDWASGIAVDTVQALYVTGTTLSNDFPTTPNAYNPSFNGDQDIFVVRMHLSSAEPDKATYATYLGGNFTDFGQGVATDTASNAFATGSSATKGGTTPPSNAPAVELKVATPPGAPVVTVGASSTNLSLTWGAVASATSYQVFRSAAPYFKPGDWSSLSPFPSTTSLYWDNGVLGQIGAYFYVVKAVGSPAATGPNSNRVGEFSYQLVKGG